MQKHAVFLVIEPGKLKANARASAQMKKGL